MNPVKNLLWVIRRIFAYQKSFLFISIFMAIVQGGSSPFLLMLVRVLLVKIQKGASIEQIIMILIIYTLSELIFSIISKFDSFFKKNFSLNFNMDLNRKILDKTSKLSLSQFENSQTYDQITRAQTESQDKLLFYFESYLALISLSISIALYGAFLLTLETWIAVVVLVIPVLNYLIMNKVNKESFQIYINRTNTERKVWYIKHLITYGFSYKELKIYSLFKYFIDKYIEYSKEFNKIDINLEKKSLFLSTIVLFVESITDLIIFIFICVQGVLGKILLGDVVTYINSLGDIQDKVNSMIIQLADIRKNSLYIDLIRDFLSLKEEIRIGKEKIDHIESIRIKNLSFKYDLLKEETLKNINLEIKKGETIALLGQNGSGKSTLVKLILGFYDDYSGDIFINDINLRDIDISSLQRRASVVFQDYIKYEATLRENLCYSDLNNIHNDQKLYEIAKRFKLDDIIATESSGIDVQIGSWFDEGRQLSIGQWQKVALARAFLKDSDIIVLDEPNSSLDPISEGELSKYYFESVHEKIGIIVAHKFGFFSKKVNKIVVLSDGKISEEGTHEELFEKKGLYHKLNLLQ